MSISTRKPLVDETRASYFRREVMTWPNAATSVRGICALCIAVWSEIPGYVFAFAFIGALSDLVDGWLAKTFHMGTDFGKRYDQYVDWCFGIALMYGIFVAGGLITDDWPYNGQLLILIGGYLLIRTMFPTAETVWIAKVKTFMQFFAGVLILAAYALPGQKIDLLDHTFHAVDLLNAGYLVVWSSVGLMVISLRDYFRK